MDKCFCNEDFSILKRGGNIKTTLPIPLLVGLVRIVIFVQIGLLSFRFWRREEGTKERSHLNCSSWEEKPVACVYGIETVF